MRPTRRVLCQVISACRACPARRGMGSHRDTSQQSSRGPGLGSPKGHIPSTVHRLKLVTIQLILWRSCHSACESIADRVSCCMGPLPHAVSRLPACVQAARPRPETIGNDIPRASAVQLHRILSVRIMPGGKIKWRFNLVVWVMCEAIICREGAMTRKGVGAEVPACRGVSPVSTVPGRQTSSAVESCPMA